MQNKLQLETLSGKIVKMVYVESRNKLILVKFYQHKGERSIRKAIKGSMVLNDSFVYFEIIWRKRVQQDRVRNNEKERTLVDLSANKDKLHQFGNLCS